MLDLRANCCDEVVIGPEDLQPFGNEMKPGDIVILWTGWGAKKWNAHDLSYWFKSTTLSRKAPHGWSAGNPKRSSSMLRSLGARKLGLCSRGFRYAPRHSGSGRHLLEGVTDLDKLSKKRFLFCGAPLKVMNAEAAPARFFAIED